MSEHGAAGAASRQVASQRRGAYSVDLDEPGVPFDPGWEGALQRIAAKRAEALSASREQPMEPLPETIAEAAEAEAEHVEQ